MDIALDENLGPKVGLTTLDEVSRLLLEHRVIVRDGNKLVVAETFSISDVCQVRVSCLTELSDDQWFIKLKEKQSMEK